MPACRVGREPETSPQFGEQPQIRRLHRDVESAGGVVGDDEVGASARASATRCRAPSVSSPVAGRRRVRPHRPRRVARWPGWWRSASPPHSSSGSATDSTTGRLGSSVVAGPAAAMRPAGAGPAARASGRPCPFRRGRRGRIRPGETGDELTRELSCRNPIRRPPRRRPRSDAERDIAQRRNHIAPLKIYFPRRCTHGDGAHMQMAHLQNRCASAGCRPERRRGKFGAMACNRLA